MILVDTSAWIEVLRGRRREAFASIAPNHEIVTCLPVIQEVLQGFDSFAVQRVARTALDDIPTIEEPLTRPVFDEAIRLFLAARRVGLTVRSGVDCLIAACAIRNDAMVVHVDRDFEKLARVSPLRTHRLAE
jgi:Predicted nucleic acid-binding protein, contains PIN domain